jgi:hypothetical protein
MYVHRVQAYISSCLLCFPTVVFFFLSPQSHYHSPDFPNQLSVIMIHSPINEDSPHTPDNGILHSPASNTRSKRTPVEELDLQSERKKRLPFKEQQQQKTNTDNLLQELDSFRKCCLKACYSWFLLQLLAYCRSQYILLPDLESRRRWLAAEHARLATGTSSYAYNIDLNGIERKECCLRAWLFAYGIPRRTHDRYSNGKQQLRAKLPGNDTVTNPPLTSASFSFVVWLLQFAAKVGDKLPFGDACLMKTQLRLPYPSKTVVFEI